MVKSEKISAANPVEAYVVQQKKRWSCAFLRKALKRPLLLLHNIRFKWMRCTAFGCAALSLLFCEKH
jgi:hypothetical protein